MAARRDPSVAIIGAGMSGLCMAITLIHAGVSDVTVYEKADDVGGTWRDNTYPGLSCDVPSRTYQYSFALRPGWSRFFSPGAEIHDYFRGIVDRYGLAEKIRFGTEVVSADFTDNGWRIATSTGDTVSADFVISAAGVLRIPKIPAIPGLQDFAGNAFHSARWDHSVPLEGRGIAVIGTGSTGAQIVTAMAPVAHQVVLFQRTPQWILPLPNPRYTRLGTAAHRRIPALGRLSYRGYLTAFDQFSDALIHPGWKRELIGGLCRANLRTVRNPQLRRSLTPSYQPMCKRLVMSAGFYPAMQRDNVELITRAIDHVEAGGIVTADGVLHEVDVIALATGFDAHAFMRPMRITGPAGLTLEEAWRDGPRAFNTVALPGFPNFFMVMGPHSPIGNYSLTAVAETQARHAAQWITRWRDGEFDTVEPTAGATEAFNRDIHEAMPGTVWASGCDSWYLDKDGVPEVWPWSPAHHRHRLAHPDPRDYMLTAPLSSPGPSAHSPR